MNDDEFQDILSKIKGINKGLGRDFITKGSEAFIEARIPTGSLGLDIALNGGWPMGRTCLLWGLKGGTKSTLALTTIANAQKMGKVCLYLDTEGTFTTEWATQYGVDTDKMFVVKSRTIETILENLRDLLPSVDVVVIDSISMIYSEKFFTDDNGQMGQQARATKELVNKLGEWNNKALVIVISQGTTKIANSYVETRPTGGLFLEHAVSIDIRLNAPKKQRINERITFGNQVLEFPSGLTVEWFLEKNKVGYDKLRGKYKWTHQGGIDLISEIVDLGITYGVIDKRGSWLYLSEDDKHHGEDKLLEYLHENTELADKLKDEILGKALH